MVLLVAGDIVAVLVSYLAAYLIRDWVLGRALHLVAPAAPLHVLGERAYALVVYPFVFAYEGLYTKRLMGWEETRRYFRGILVATAAAVILLFLWRAWIVSRVVVLVALPTGMLLVPLLRAMLRRLLVRLRILRYRLVLLGEEAATGIFSRELARHYSMGYVVDQQVQRADADERLSDVLDRVDARPGSSLVIFSDSFRPEEVREVFDFAERRFSEVMVVPNEMLLQSAPSEIEQVGSILVMKYRYNLLRPVSIFTKQALEVVFTTLLLVLLAPTLAVVAAIVRLSSQGPVVFRQKRIGRGARIFTCFKFRTMYVDAEQRLESILAGNAAVRAEWEQYARITDDPRVTPVGRFLRRFSIDEFPQLWNVMRGEMALVGPRPYLPSEMDRVGSHMDAISRVRPGMTGLWQVSGRAALPFHERMVLDEYYIRNWSLWMDFLICLRTLKAVVSGRGAY
jgi:Undecaprenyl-phosphate galactose phosphotransferase WbaP